jgi:short-subunit dehydrogenase
MEDSMSSREVPQQVVVITGASAGVGRALARKFGSRHAKVGLIARGLEGLEAAKREIEMLGGEALVLQADVADADQIERAAQQTEETLGPIDVWINNAMTSVFSPVRELKAEEIRRVTEVTYLGYVHGTLSALRRMLPRDTGTIVQVGSALAYRGIPLQAAYCGAKHAIQGFTDSLHSELLHDGSSVRLTEVNLPAINTPQFDWVLSRLPNRAQPVPPILQPEVAADAIVWAVDHHRRSWNIGWPTTKAVVGNSFFPGYGDRYLATRGVESQQTDQPEVPDRPHNLWSPLPGDHGAHGRFDDQASEVSLHVLLNRYRAPLLAAGSAIAATSLISKALRRRKRRKEPDPEPST